MKERLENTKRKIPTVHEGQEFKALCAKQSIGSVASLSKFQWCFSEKYKSRLKTCRTTKYLISQSNFEKSEGLAFLISNYITHQAEMALTYKTVRRTMELCGKLTHRFTHT